MNPFLQIFLLSCGFFFFSIVVILLLRFRINERYSILWLIGAVLILIIAGYPTLIDQVSLWLGIAYPPTLIFLLSTMVLLLLTLYQAIQISKLNSKVKDITQFLALQERKND